jgi:streptogramin lyase
MRRHPMPLKNLAGRLAVVLAAVTVSVTAGGALAATASPRPIHIPPGFYDLSASGGMVWLAETGETSLSIVRRIDPATGRILRTWTLDSAAGGFAAGPGALWVSMYYTNTIEKIDERTGRRLASIRVALQPESVHLAFGSVWVSSHHGASVTRINPRTDRVIAVIPAGTPRTFSSGPQQITSDGRFVYVGASNGDFPLTVINPRTNIVVRHPGTPSTFCGDTVAAQGSVWSGDICSNTLFRLNTTTGQATFTRKFRNPVGLTSIVYWRREIWVAFDRHYNFSTDTGTGGVVQELNPSTGAVIRTDSVGGDATFLRAAAGHLWLIDGTSGFLRQLALH